MNESKSAPTSPRLAQLFDLSGQVALITGGSGELGMQIAEALGEYGARILLAARKPDRLDSAVARLRAQAIDASAIACDLSQSGAAEVLVEEIARQHGRLDILVNNAAILLSGSFADFAVNDWDRLMAVNLRGAMLCAQQAFRL
ncbi:MAG: SDR family NAD(P)-dependent oxidoreductase, partial [Xanthomonadales bacterium]|nr:SDR family NAD(P)-dependent oxidoreductase [Xanthomonadales bacterium]